MIFYPDNNFQLIFMMLQINCTNHFLNLAENVLFMQFLKKWTSSNFYQFFQKHFKINKKWCHICFMNNKYTSISGGANMNHSATEKSHPFLHTSGSNQVKVFVNKTKNTE